MRRSYLGAVCGSPGSYGIVFRDFPGCTSAGDTIDEVLAMGAEALEGHIGLMVEFDEVVPDPTVYTIADVERWLSDPGETLDEQWLGVYPVEIDVPAGLDTVALRVKADIVERIAELSRVSPRQIDSRRFIEDAVEHEIERYRRSA